MRMYGAFLLALIVGYLWPDQNMFTTPFSELTLKLIIGSLFAAWLGYCTLQLALSSLQKDLFWPWKWTRQIAIMLAVRLGWMLAFFGAAALLASGWPKFDLLINEYPIVSAIICFIVVSFCICADDKDFAWDDGVEKIDPQPSE